MHFVCRFHLLSGTAPSPSPSPALAGEGSIIEGAQTVYSGHGRFGEPPLSRWEVEGLGEGTFRATAGDAGLPVVVIEEADEGGAHQEIVVGLRVRDAPGELTGVAGADGEGAGGD